MLRRMMYISIYIASRPKKKRWSFFRHDDFSTTKLADPVTMQGFALIQGQGELEMMTQSQGRSTRWSLGMGNSSHL